jgi:hypothetical protein
MILLMRGWLTSNWRERDLIEIPAAAKRLISSTDAAVSLLFQCLSPRRWNSIGGGRFS